MIKARINKELESLNKVYWIKDKRDNKIVSEFVPGDQLQ